MLKVKLLDGRNGFLQILKLQFIYTFELAFTELFFWGGLILVDGER